MKLPLLFFSVLLLLSGCGFARGEHQLFITADLVPAKRLKSANDVQIFYGEARPKSGCVMTAGIVANGNIYATQEDFLKVLKEEAFRVGADIVLVGPSGHTSMQVGTYGGGIALGEQINYPYLTGVACRSAAIWHGIRFAADKMQMSQRVVRYVYDGSPAYKAGIREGDELLTINGTFLGDDPTAWDRHINASQPQTMVTVQFVRNGNKQAVQMILESP